MFGIGSSELLLILVVALIVLGPKNLPKVAQTLGKAMGEFRRVSTDFQRTLNTELAVAEEKEKKKEIERLEAEDRAAAAKAAEAKATETASAGEFPVAQATGESAVAQATGESTGGQATGASAVAGATTATVMAELVPPTETHAATNGVSAATAQTFATDQTFSKPEGTA